MFQKFKLIRSLAIGAFVATLLSAPFTSTAKAGSDYRSHKRGYSVEKEYRGNHGHHWRHYAHRHYRNKHARKHRRIRHEQAYRHNYRNTYKHNYRNPYKTVRKEVHIYKYPEQRRRHVISDRELFSGIIGALIGSQLANHR
jgi:hypothetical protein